MRTRLAAFCLGSRAQRLRATVVASGVEDDGLPLQLLRAHEAHVGAQPHVVGDGLGVTRQTSESALVRDELWRLTGAAMELHHSPLYTGRAQKTNLRMEIR